MMTRSLAYTSRPYDICQCQSEVLKIARHSGGNLSLNDEVNNVVTIILFSKILKLNFFVSDVKKQWGYISNDRDFYTAAMT